jgi:hypothetical protein
MIKATVIADAKVLLPNKDHKNFTETTEIIEEGSLVKGKPVNIQGLRRGQAFVYRLFMTENNKLIHLKKIKPMKATEVTLGADAKQTPTVVNIKPAENSDRAKFIGTLVGGVAGFAYAKYKKHDNKKALKFVAIGAVLGFAVGYFMNSRNNKINITPSK